MTTQQQRRQSQHRSYSPPALPSFHSMSSISRSGSKYGTVPAPRHPVPSMQAAFEESILDLGVGSNISAGTSNSGTGSSSSQGSRQRRCHPRHHRLLKVISQIAFGIHLLHARLAKSDPEVVRILQSHVNDMDFFVSSTTNDFDMAKSDIRQRLKHLRIPIDSVRTSEVFDKMLENREFRLEIIKGNQNVEYVISRTVVAMKSALIDVREGLGAVDALAKYLLSLKRGWKNTNVIRVYTAITFNVEQWFTGLVALRTKGVGLKEELEQLRRVVREIDQRIGVASRKHKDSIIVVTNKGSCPNIPENIHKPLPATPGSNLTAIDIRRPKPHTSKKTPKHYHLLTSEKQKTPTITVAEGGQEPQPTQKVPLRRTISQRLRSRPRARSKDTTENELEFQEQRRLSKVQAQPVTEVWPGPLSVKSGEVTEDDDKQEAELSFNPNKLQVKNDPKEKVLKRPQSCTIS